jgi:hypothetical protein
MSDRAGRFCCHPEDRVNALLNRGDIYDRMGEYDRALRNFDQEKRKG